MALFPLTAFEKYMILDEHPGCEMVIMIEWAFKGKINRDLIVEAYKRVVKHEPLFKAVLSKEKNRFNWNVDDQFLMPLLFETTEKSIEQDEGTRNVLPINIEKCCGKIILREYVDGVAFEFYIHHTIGDGIGVNQLLADWIKEYDLLLHGQDNTEELNYHPDVSLFGRRAESHFVPSKQFSFATMLYTRYKGIIQWLLHRPLSILKKPKATSAQLSDQRPMYWRRFGQEFFLQYKQLAKTKGVSVNTLMMRDLFITLRKWIEKYPVDNTAVERQKRWFRLLMPMNIRTDFHRTIPCAMIVGYIFIDRKPVECDRTKEFLDGIHDKITTCRNFNLGTSFTNGIAFVDKFPSLLSRLITDKYCYCTITLSSVGNICKSCQQEDYRNNDDIKVEHDQYPLQLFRMIGAPPIRPHMPISIGVMQRQNEAFISCQYDLNAMSEQTMMEFYNMFVEEMKQTLEEG